MSGVVIERADAVPVVGTQSLKDEFAVFVITGRSPGKHAVHHLGLEVSVLDLSELTTALNLESIWIGRLVGTHLADLNLVVLGVTRMAFVINLVRMPIRRTGVRLAGNVR